MNTIAFNNINTVPNRIISNNAQNRPAFYGKTLNTQQAKKGMNVAQKLYKLFFIPSKETITKSENGSIYTKSFNGPNVISKKYPIWSSKPSEIIERNDVTSIAKRKIMNSDGSYGLEIKDMHVPEYKISASYENVTTKASPYDMDYTGGVKIKYCDKEVSISNDQRLKLMSELNDNINSKFSDNLYESLNNGEKMDAVMNKYYLDSDVIGMAILESPQSLDRHLKKVPAGMPYGIESILEKLGK